MRPGAAASLADRARALVGGRDSPPTPAGAYPAQAFLESGEVDVFLTYRSNARLMADRFSVVMPPPPLAVTAEYGLIVLATEPDRRRQAEAAMDALLAPEGQALLARHGFLPAIDPTGSA